MHCASLGAGAVQVRIPKTVLIAAFCVACTTPAKEPAAAAGGTPAHQAAPPQPLSATTSSSTAASAPAPSASASAARSVTGSAYFGCGEPIPRARLWDETTESEVLEAITAAKLCAASG